MESGGHTRAQPGQARLPGEKQHIKQDQEKEGPPAQKPGRRKSAEERRDAGGASTNH